MKKETTDRSRLVIDRQGLMICVGMHYCHMFYRLDGRWFHSDGMMNFGPVTSIGVK